MFQHLLNGHPHPEAPGAITHAGRYDALGALAFAGRRSAYYRRLVTLAGVKPGDRVLEVGCGPGHLAAQAAQAVGPNGSVIGVDPSAPMIRLAERRRGGGNREFRVGFAENLDTADASKDAVVSSFVIHHIPETARQRAFAEMYRVLRPGGRLLIGEFRPPSGRLARHLIGALAGHVMRDIATADLAPMIRAAGFTVIAEGRLRPFTHYVSAVKPG